MQIDAHTSTHRPHRAFACLALLLALLVSAALSAGAFARSAHGHRATCGAARHARHAAGRHCAKHHGRKGSHKAKKETSAPTAPAPSLTPAGCEDGTTPVRSTGSAYACEDGSEPACEDGSDPIRPNAASPPMCRVPREDAGLECGFETTGECGPELACEDAEEAVSGPQGCEHGSAFEEEASLEA